MVPGQATAPVLIIVGVMMAEAFAGINWKELDEAIPAFFTVSIMTFAYNISYGIAAGFIFYCLAKVCKKKANEVHPILWGATALFLLNFVLLAII
jgi:AGZA family xanthine/uracil permease-like MFS transporter